jgi:diguanylate cyclase (GGDEF)-like protein
MTSPSIQTISDRAITKFLNPAALIENELLSVDHGHLLKILHKAIKRIGMLEADLHDHKKKIAKKDEYISALQALLTTDELTLITNRRGFFDHFDHELDRVQRGLSKGGILMMIDLDNFKAINDTYGHNTGDAALKLVAKTLTSYIRKMDCAARLGGDEFVILFVNADRDQSLDRAQKLARKLNRLILKHDGHRIGIKASLGIKSYEKGDSVTSVLGHADTAMYNDKKDKKK